MTTVFEMPRMDRVLYGPDAADRLGEQTRALGMRRLLVVASNTLATNTDVVDQLAGDCGRPRCSTACRRTCPGRRCSRWLRPTATTAPTDW